MLERDGVEIMIQTRASVENEIFVREPGGHILGFAEMSEPGPDGD